MINHLNSICNNIDSDLNKLYRKTSLLYKKINHYYRKEQVIEVKVYELKYKIKSIKKFNIFETLLIASSIIIFLTSLFKNTNSFFIFILMITIEIIIIIRKNNKISRINNMILSFINEEENHTIKREHLEINAKKLEKDIVKMRFKKSSLKDSIQFYNNELSKIMRNESYLNKEYKKNKDYVKR